MLVIFTDPNYNLEAKHIYSIGLCVVAVGFGSLYRFADIK
jgi:hypothetical protein